MNQMVDLGAAIDVQDADAAFESRLRRREKNLVDAIMTAFHSACDLKEFSVAWRLLHSLENTIRTQKDSAGFDLRRTLAVLVAGHERLWDLRHR